MDQSVIEKIFDHWKQCRQASGYPEVAAFLALVREDHPDRFVHLQCRDGDVFAQCFGAKISATLPVADLQQSIFMQYAPAMRPTQMALMMPCFQEGLTMHRQSRFWLGDRHCDIEILLMPAMNSETEQIEMVGVIAAHRSALLEKSEGLSNELIERIAQHSYFSLGNTGSICAFDSQIWAVLEAMDAVISLDGVEMTPPPFLMPDDASRQARQTNHINVLIAGAKEDFDALTPRLGPKCRLLHAADGTTALESLEDDMIDVLVTAEFLTDMAGIDLVERARGISSYTASIVIHEGAASMPDRPAPSGHMPDMVTDHICKPVGEFTLMQAINDAGARARMASRSPIFDLAN